MRVGRRVRCLSFHADYGCRNTGVCCSSGWEIAVETEVEIALRVRLSRSANLPNGPDGFQSMDDPPQNCKSALRRVGSHGTCWFRDDTDCSCALHREFGENTLPSACRQFPRVCVIEPDVVSLSLSHYCPTAAAMLFRDGMDFQVVADPLAFPAQFPFEGLDCRNAYPPFLRSGVLLGFDGLRAFEEHAVAALARGDIWSGVAAIEASARVARSWTPAEGSLVDFIPKCFDVSTVSEPPLRYADPRPTLEAALAKGTPTGVVLPEYEPGVPSFSSPIDLALRRYLAARLIAGWVTYQAEDLRVVVKYLGLCLNTVFLFASVGSDASGETSRWKEAVRNADLWILHYSDPERLARVLG